MPSTRYRHPGDVIRLIGSGLVLTVMLAAVAVAPGRLTGSGAAAVTWLGSDPAGRLLTGLVQVAFVLAATGVAVAALWHRRFRLLAGLRPGRPWPASRWQASCTWRASPARGNGSGRA